MYSNGLEKSPSITPLSHLAWERTGSTSFCLKTRRGFLRALCLQLCVHAACSRHSGARGGWLSGGGAKPIRVIIGKYARWTHTHGQRYGCPGEGGWGYDPTAAVAPERIERGAQGLANDDMAYWGGSGLSVMRYGNYKLFRQARQMMDYVNYRWQQKRAGL
jgi:hypothetical protein